MNRQLTLLLPGLLGISGRSPQPAVAAGLQTQGLLAFLAKSRLQKYDVSLLADALWALFSLPPQQQKAIASLTRLADCGQASGLWSRADPVHLHADRDDVMLMPLGHDGPTVEESRQLLDLINTYFDEAGLHFDAPQSQRWYLAGECLTMPGPDELAGQHIQQLTAPGQADRRWFTLMNEIQMLLHSSDVNHQRNERGLPTINSLWLWGGGALPDRGHPDWASVWTGHALATGLAQHHAVPWQPVPHTAGEWLNDAGPGSHLLVDDQCFQLLQSGSSVPWGSALSRFSEDWFVPLLKALSEGQLQRLSLMPLNGTVYELSRVRFRRQWPWRKKPALADYFVKA